MFSYISSYFYEPEPTYDLKVYPLAGGSYFGNILIEENPATRNTSLVETIVIIDKSSAMDDDVNRIVTKVLPLVFASLAYDPEKTIHVITFDESSTSYQQQVKDFRTFPIFGYGDSIMAPAVQSCQETLKMIGNKKPIRLLTISNGDIDDVPETVAATEALLDFMKDKDYCINSQVVRLFTNTNNRNHDTRAISSLLQANSTTIPRLIDISCMDTPEVIAQKISEMFINDKLDHRRILMATDDIILKTPWDPSPSNQILLKLGDNMFWFKNNPKEEIKIGDVVVNIEMQLLTDEINFKIQKKIQAKKFKKLKSRTLIAKTEDQNEEPKSKLKAEKTQLTATRHRKRQFKSANTKMIKELKKRLNDLSQETRVLAEIAEETHEPTEESREHSMMEAFMKDLQMVEAIAEKNYIWIMAVPVIALIACELLRR